MTMALACDIRLASESASFGCPFTRIGLTPEFGSAYFLPRLVGYAKAAEWVLTSRMIQGKEALSTGLVSEAVRTRRGCCWRSAETWARHRRHARDGNS
jgi:2-(1,2-epoxy-1,2-dihydrophenyl)acetyl-CoA isomerase